MTRLEDWYGTSEPHFTANFLHTLVSAMDRTTRSTRYTCICIRSQALELEDYGCIRKVREGNT